MRKEHHKTHIITLDQFNIEQKVFNKPEVCYTLYGDFSNGKKSALFFHGFSSDSLLHLWWDKFPFDKILEDYNILCINSLGSCHGSFGPLSINHHTGTPYLDLFPYIGIKDTVNFAVAVLHKLQLDTFDLAFGCSLGGMQVLDMFIRFPKIADKFISVCGSPLSLMAKLINAAQCNIIESGIKKLHSDEQLKSQMSLARFFFRLSCTTEQSLAMLAANQGGDLLEVKGLEEYFIADSLKYKNEFSPYSYNLYMRMLLNFELDIPEVGYPIYNSNAGIVLVDITGDTFTPPERVDKVYALLKSKKYIARKLTFETLFGHEAWILDGDNFYEFIKSELTA